MKIKEKLNLGYKGGGSEEVYIFTNDGWVTNLFLQVHLNITRRNSAVILQLISIINMFFIK